MTDRYVKVLENDRYVAQGVKESLGTLTVEQSENDSLDYVIDWTDWLDGDTIDSVTGDTANCSQSLANTTTTVTATISGVQGRGYARHTITLASSGEVRELTIETRQAGGHTVNDYR